MKTTKKVAVAAKKEKPSSKLPLVDSKLTEKVRKCQSDLETYFKVNKLDPTKDWTKDKKHGAKVKELTAILNTARKKVEDAAPKEIHHKKSEDKKGDKKSKSTLYDYPKVDGREMTPAEKKKYRIKMRKENNKGEKKAETKKVEKAPAKAPVKTSAKAEKAAPVTKKKKFKKRNED